MSCSFLHSDSCTNATNIVNILIDIVLIVSLYNFPLFLLY